MKNKVIIINTYFGKLPNYFQLWLDSCGKNPEFNWVVVTDDNLNGNYIIPENVSIAHMSLSDVEKRIYYYLNLKNDYLTAYKLCDFKPTYAAIFPELVKGYTHWGFCDLDVIWGVV